MFAARTTAARRGPWRRSAVTLFAAISLASLALVPAAGPALGADPSPATPQPSATQPSDPALTPTEQRVENVITAAKQYLGVPYHVGSEGPGLFDCSGLVFRAFSDAGLLDRIGNMRLRAAGYMRWFANRGQMTTDETQAQRGDLVIYSNGAHIGIYLGDGRTISALLTGVTVHSLHGVSLPVTGFLRPDWSGDGKVAPFVPVALADVPDVPETPATLVPAAAWMPTLDATVSAPASRDGTERTDLRTLNSRTFENPDGTFTTEFHAQPIFYQPAGTTDPAQLKPIDLTFRADKKTGNPTVKASPVGVTARSADDPAGLVTATAGRLGLSLGLPSGAGTQPSSAVPQLVDNGRVVDFFDLQPGLGMRVLAQPDGFKSFVVLAKEPSKNRISFTLNAPGLTATLADDGSVTLLDENGAIAGRIPRALVLDSSDADGNGGGVFANAASFSLDTSGPAPVLAIVLDRSKLDEAVFPAYIDLSLTDFPAQATGADVSFVSSGHPNANLHGLQRPELPGFDELWLGHQPKSKNDNEVFVRFADLSTVLGTVDVASAQLELLPYFQRSNDGVTVVRRVAADWNADDLTWTTKPATADDDAMSVTSEAGSWTSLDVSDYVADVLSRGKPDFGLALAGDDSSNGTWKRLAGSDAGGDEFGPRLVVTWSGLRPTAQASDPALAPAPGVMPTLAWTQPQLASAQVRFQVQVSHDGFATTVVDSGAVKGKAGTQAHWTVPDDALTTGGSNSWRVRVKYGTDPSWSPWSAAQTFNITLLSPPHGAI